MVMVREGTKLIIDDMTVEAKLERRRVQRKPPKYEYYYRPLCRKKGRITKCEFTVVACCHYAYCRRRDKTRNLDWESCVHYIVNLRGLVARTPQELIEAIESIVETRCRKAEDEAEAWGERCFGLRADECGCEATTQVVWDYICYDRCGRSSRRCCYDYPECRFT